MSRDIVDKPASQLLFQDAACLVSFAPNRGLMPSNSEWVLTMTSSPLLVKPFRFQTF